jgi:hypothetical protein
MRQAEEAPGFFGNVCEVDQTERVPDHVQQIAIFPRGRVLPFTGSAFHAVVQPDEHGSASRVSDIANLPVIALFATIREIVTAHRLGLPAETLRQFGSVETRHYAASRSPMRSTGKRSSSLPVISGPVASTGTKKRSFHEMISLKRP